jgi:hypothetical protein
VSIPISQCLVNKAACGDEKSYLDLVEKFKVNMLYGHWSVIPCRCNPQCEATQEQIDILNSRLDKEDWPKANTGINGPKGHEGKPGGDYSI